MGDCDGLGFAVGVEDGGLDGDDFAGKFSFLLGPCGLLEGAG